MKYVSLYDNNKIPALGLGTWGMGGGTFPNYAQDKKVMTAIRAALELGYRHIDTAEMYAGGHTEELVGKAIRGFPRGDLFVTSKVWHNHLHYQDVRNALEGSLRRMGIEYLDLYLIHWPNNRVPLEETFKALNELLDEGLVKYLGVSNFNLTQLQKAITLSHTPLITNQVHYSLYNRNYEKNGVLAYCQDHNILLTAYTPIEKGRVSRDKRLKRMAARYTSTPVQIALAWLIQQTNVIAIPMSTNRAHLEENMGALEIELSKDDVAILNRS
jgi:diketogulonate reductase-like aldo/keto reductase